MEISTHFLLNRSLGGVWISLLSGLYDLLVSGDLSTPGNPNTEHEKEDFVLSQVGVDVIAPSVAEDAEAHTSMEIDGGSDFVANDNGSLEQGSEDGLMQDDTKLTKVGGSSADEPVLFLKIRSSYWLMHSDGDLQDGAIEIVDESLKGAW
ncbi:hypothetical protein Tco_0843624 [Tanacetum coccineum]|uniref:Uncharacterized protein n=1 Tax=Tanacetum coccineum TaxID=301880 RepID=A0ABQ5B657_9ASTR